MSYNPKEDVNSEYSRFLQMAKEACVMRLSFDEFSSVYGFAPSRRLQYQDIWNEYWNKERIEAMERDRNERDCKRLEKQVSVAMGIDD